MKKFSRFYKARDNRVNVLVLAPLMVEYLGIRSMLASVQDFIDPKTNIGYSVGYLKGVSNEVRIALRKCGKGRLAVSEGVREGLDLFKPELLVLFGTAGGLRKVEIGDIVVGTAGYDYESGQVGDNHFFSRPMGLPANRLWIEKAEQQALQKTWMLDLPASIASSPNVFFGPVASGDKVLQSNTAPLAKMLRERFNDAIALEMESYAFLYAASKHLTIDTLMIRGISDRLGDKVDANANNSRELAVTNAAVFLKYLLEKNSKWIPLRSSRTVRRNLAWVAFLVMVLIAGTLAVSGIQKPVVTLSAFTVPVEALKQDTLKAEPALNPERKAVLKTKDKAIISRDAPLVKEVEDLNLDTAMALPEAVPESAKSDSAEAERLRTPTEEKPKEEKLYLYKIYVFNSAGSRLSGASYLIDGEPVLREGNKFRLPAGKHELEIITGQQPPFRTIINVPPRDNGQTIINWDF
ncbi:MAG: 5'-methylthioadenosine/S-adenosylhomocysteine nucleosidase [bacterium]|nr:5'-methylthioadenosine/S-adenosylhomocysteine nucleosidase [bacterium]